MIDFCTAKRNMAEELIDMNVINFGETYEAVKIFFDNQVNYENCFICKDGNKIVSQVHTIPFFLKSDLDLIPAHYIYYASTLKEYRNKGFMSGLIKYALMSCEKRGDVFSVLTPADRSLFKFYSFLGYKEFYKYREISLDMDRLNELLKKIKRKDDASNKSSINFLEIKERTKKYNAEPIWDKSTLNYAILMNEFSGGINISNEYGYAMTNLYDKNKVNVYDIRVSDDYMNDLLYDIYCKYKIYRVEKYNLKLPLRNNFFGEEGTVVSNVMIRPTSERFRCIFKEFIDKNMGINPYFGFTME